MTVTLDRYGHLFMTGTPWLIRLTSGLFRPRRIVPGADIAGMIVAVGRHVDDLSVGDVVFGEAPGGCSPFAVVAADHVARIPEGVDSAVRRRRRSQG